MFVSVIYELRQQRRSDCEGCLSWFSRFMDFLFCGLKMYTQHSGSGLKKFVMYSRPNDYNNNNAQTDKQMCANCNLVVCLKRNSFCVFFLAKCL